MLRCSNSVVVCTTSVDDGVTVSYADHTASPWLATVPSFRQRINYTSNQLPDGLRHRSTDILSHQRESRAGELSTKRRVDWTTGLPPIRIR